MSSFEKAGNKNDLPLKNENITQFISPSEIHPSLL